MWKWINNIFCEDTTWTWEHKCSYISLYFCCDCWPRLVNDSIDLLDDVEVGLVVGVLHPRTSPWHIWQLTRRQGSTHTDQHTVIWCIIEITCHHWTSIVGYCQDIRYKGRFRSYVTSYILAFYEFFFSHMFAYLNTHMFIHTKNAVAITQDFSVLRLSLTGYYVLTQDKQEPVGTG